MSRQSSGFILRLGHGFRSRFPGRRNAPRRLREVPQPKTLVVLLDGTMSSLEAGRETNIGQIFRLLEEQEHSDNLQFYYEPGIQWRGFRYAHEVIAGIGINRQIRRAYRFLAKSYRPGDRIVLLGYSRGAYAVRSLAGLIDRMGLLRKAHAKPDEIERLYELYRQNPDASAARSMRETLCHAEAKIDFIGVFDTVRALGVRWPVIWRFTGEPHPYHNHRLGQTTLVGRQALALNETRDAYKPVLWHVSEAAHCEGSCNIQQMWFRGTHGDVGGQLNGRMASRPLANVSLIWMLEEAEAMGLPLPQGWRGRFEVDPKAPSIGPFAGWSKLFLDRSRRKVGQDPTEHIHETAADAAERVGLKAFLVTETSGGIAGLKLPQ